MAKKDFKPKTLTNALDAIHGTEESENNQIDNSKNKKGRPQQPDKKRLTFFINSKYEQYIALGKRKEEFDSKSDLIEHILEDYFKNKPYIKNLQKAT